MNAVRSGVLLGAAASLALAWRVHVDVVDGGGWRCLVFGLHTLRSRYLDERVGHVSGHEVTVPVRRISCERCGAILRDDGSYS